MKWNGGAREKRVNENEEYDNQQFDDDDGRKSSSSQATSGCTENAERTRKCKKILKTFRNSVFNKKNMQQFYEVIQ